MSTSSGDSTDRGRKTPADWDESTIAPSGASIGQPHGDAGQPLGDQAYLLVFEGASSSMFSLPAAGDVTIGRGEGATLRLSDTSVSRMHAQVTMAAGEARICDLESQNGTLVNGERITGTRRLFTGDTISICSISIVFHASVRMPAGVHRPILKFEEMRRRTEEEIERALHYHRPLTTLVAILQIEPSHRPRVAHALGASLRILDVVGSGASDQLIILMPECDVDLAPQAAARVLKSLVPIAPGAKVGFATCPHDGCDVETLVSSAREAALAADAGNVGAAARTYETKRIADHTVIVADPAMSRLYALIERLAAAELPVLICGETGTGKELAARAVHQWSARKAKSLVAFNCAALSENLVESELFGHEKGAFSGAVAAKSGLLEVASGSTVFLDEIGEMSPTTQAKLLRVLETKRVIRVGDVREREIDIRLVAATNRNLADEVKAGRFRQDLFFRLSAATLWLPPLRDRRRELAILAQTFLAEACKQANRATMEISDDAMQRLATYEWPGNVRELKNVMDYVAAAFTEPVLQAWHLSRSLSGPSEGDEDEELQAAAPKRGRTNTPLSIPIVGSDSVSPTKFRPIEDEIKDLERRRMIEALAAAGGNQTRAADLIAMPLRTFQAKLRFYDIPRPGQKSRG
ncbi:MAG TPA: sigma 54-interacting transcriptional regulator [Kofleriaceae bacterium]|nr:sigma 54-interacting transcriptional regulator [Kofleriaceae bacterium]